MTFLRHVCANCLGVGGQGIPPEPKGLVDATDTCVGHCPPLLASEGEVKSRPRRSSTDADCFLWLDVSALGVALGGGVELPFVWALWRCGEQGEPTVTL